MSFMLGGFANGLFQGAEGIFRMYGEAQHAHYYQALTKRMNFETEREQQVWEAAQKAGNGSANAGQTNGALPTPGPGAPPVKNAPKGDMPDPGKLPPPPYLLDAKSTESTFAKTPSTSPEKPEPTFAATARESANQSAKELAPNPSRAPGNPLSPPANFYGPGPGTFVQRMMGPQPALPTQPAPTPTAPHYLPAQALPMKQDPAPAQTPVLMPQIAPAAGPGGGLTQNGPSMMPNMASSAPGIGAAILASMNPMAGATA